MTFDTIAAVATPPGNGGIAIIRVSGPSALECLQKIFSSKQTRMIPSSAFVFIPRQMHYGWALDAKGNFLDEVLAVFMPGPNSATGEDVVEIHCHGGNIIAAALLEAIFLAGARPAQAGEFTKRAFLNGRIDLTQAEAVAEAINAPTQEGVRLAEAKLRGVLGRKITDLRESLDMLRMEMTIAVDFPDDDLEIMPLGEVLNVIEAARTELGHLINTYERASLWREGATVVLAGNVNAGKSSLLNALLGRERAIVSPIPGTTRDYLEETVNIHGVAVRLIDTAGLREGGDIIEEEGIRRSQHLATGADLLILVLDSTMPNEKILHDFLQLYKEKATTGKLLIVLNKIDSLTSKCSIAVDCPIVPVSAILGDGIDALSSHIFSCLTGNTKGIGGEIAPNKRQSILLENAVEELDFLRHDILAGLSADILAVRVAHTVMLLDEVTGTTADDALLDRIFSSFCIGK